MLAYHRAGARSGRAPFCGRTKCANPEAANPGARAAAAAPPDAILFAIEHRAFRSAYGFALSAEALFDVHVQLSAARHATLYEIIHRGRPCQMYIDVEGTG